MSTLTLTGGSEPFEVTVLESAPGAPVVLFAVGALDAVQTPILAWAGSQDSITPPAQVDVLVRALSGRLPLDVRVTEGAGHFSFMDLPPPDEVEPLADRQAFLDLLAEEIGKFLKRRVAVRALRR